MPPGSSSRVCATRLLRPRLPEGGEGAGGTCSALRELFLLRNCHHRALGKRGGPQRALGFPLSVGRGFFREPSGSRSGKARGSSESPQVEQAGGPACAFSDSIYCKQYLSFRMPHRPQRANGVRSPPCQAGGYGRWSRRPRPSRPLRRLDF